MSDDPTKRDGYQEYPKMITAPDGVQKIVGDADEEAAWMRPPAPPARVSTLDDVTLEMDVPETRDHDLDLAEKADAESVSEASDDDASDASDDSKKKRSTGKKR